MKRVSILVTAFILIATALFSAVPAGSRQLAAAGAASGSDPGVYDGPEAVTWKPLRPVNGTTFVRFDGESMVDDYAYLAAVPATTFQHDGVLYGEPLLFYEPDMGLPGRAPESSLDSYQGIHYFMEDWVAASGGSLDRIAFINMETEEIDRSLEKWPAREAVVIEGDDPYELAAGIAELNWESSDAAVVVPMRKDPGDPGKEFSGSLEGTVMGAPRKHYHFEGTKYPDPVNPDIRDFDVGDGYKYIESELTWTWFGAEYPDGSTATERGKDLDLQIYYTDMDAGTVEIGASEFWNVIEGDMDRPYQPPYERVDTYAYGPGKWLAHVSYMPTKDMPEESTARSDERFYETSTGEGPGTGDESAAPAPGAATDGPEGMYQDEELSRTDWDIHIYIYPGTDFPLPETTPYMARDASFTLNWETGDELGLIVRGPGGEVISSTFGTGGSLAMEIAQLGQGEHSVSVVIKGDDPTANVDFDLEYSWRQAGRKSDGEAMASAANGAVWASENNIPLLYSRMDGVPGSTLDALDKLGVTRVYLVNLGDYASPGVAEDLEKHRKGFSGIIEDIEVDEITSFGEMYRKIQKKSDQNDIVFTTIDPWTYWLVEIGGFVGDTVSRGYYIGPAAAGAAYHGAPVLVTDVHPELSGPAAWHNEFWRQAYLDRLPPRVGDMYLTGASVYDFLDDIGIAENGLEAPRESILTVAGQFDLGTAWDRMLVGPANAGRIFGTPADTSYWIARGALYPAMIWANPAVNPALDEHGGRRLNGGHVIEPGGEYSGPTEDVMNYPISNTWVSYQHRFNERASRYWGCAYTGPSGISPFFTESGNPIDIGNSRYRSGSGMYYPDMTISEVVPFYAEKGGYDICYTTTLDTTMENLNRGTLMWYEVMHGGHQRYDHGSGGSGIVGFWDETRADQPDNPWRGYEDQGGTEDALYGMTGPDSVSMSKQAGLDAIPSGPGQPGIDTKDGIIIAIAQQTKTDYTSGFDMDEGMENIHSAGMNAGSCLIANTYLHLAMVRHGGSFQVIDPWLTSWYSAFAAEMFMRDLVLGTTVGEAYTNGIHNVGIEYLTGQWWWDIFENVVYFGDPDLRMWSPNSGKTWSRPAPLESGAEIGGHTPSGAVDHPDEINPSGTTFYIFAGILIYFLAGAALAAGVAAGRVKKDSVPGLPLYGKMVGFAEKKLAGKKNPETGPAGDVAEALPGDAGRDEADYTGDPVQEAENVD